MANQAHSKHGWFRHKPMKYGSVKKAQLVETGHNMERKKNQSPVQNYPYWPSEN